LPYATTISSAVFQELEPLLNITEEHLMHARYGLLTLTLVAACSSDDDDTSSIESSVARGKYIVDNVAVCQDCHTPRDEMGAPIAAQYLAGAACFAQLPNGSCLNTRNLTNHETGLLNRTDDEIKRMITDGIRPAATGDEALSPVMPYYVFHNMSAADLDSVVAYLRTVPGVDHAIERSGVEFEVEAAANPLPVSAIPMPMAGYEDTAAALRGRYLAAQAGVCLECHTRHIMGDANVLDYAAIFAGGEEFAVGLPVVPVSKNLTSDATTGLGEWSLDDVVRAITEGVDKDAAGICPPMPSVGAMAPYAGLAPDDARDIAHYVKSLPPIAKAIDDVCTFPPM
jgi:mono/diheme cytochrome c family protein